MKAAVLREFKAPLSIEELPSPQLDASEVLVKVEACGVCHSDLHVADGDWPQLVPITKRPLILGHEIAGRVVEKGGAVTELQVGDHVGIPWVYSTCGVCDFCDPAKCVAQRFRTATEEERMTLHRVLSALQTISSKSTGRLHAELCPGGEMSRDNFEEVLGAMARAELIKFADAVFEKQGKQIPYRTVSLTPAGRATDQTTPVLFVMKDAGRPVSKRKRQKKSSKSNASPNTTGRTQSRPPRTRTTASEPEKETRIEQALRAWRLSEAKRRNIPAFRIFGDRALKDIATNCPHNDAELLAVPGIGMSVVQKYGAHIYRLITGSR